MGKHRKSWSLEEKAKIVKYYQESGTVKTCKEFNVSSASVYRWVEELSGSVTSKISSVQEKDREIHRLQRELQSYKEIIAEKELSHRIKDALLKKAIEQGPSYGSGSWIQTN